MLYVKQLETCEAITIDTEKLKSILLDMVYPIGAIYMSVNNVSPETFIGGVWKVYGNGRTLVGVDVSQSEFSTVEKSGGSKSINIAHSHVVNSHSHQCNDSMYAGVDATATWIGVSRVGGKSYPCDVYVDIPVQGKGYTGKYGARIFGNTGSTYPNTNGQLSSTQSILPPYTTCYMWKRTA